MLKGFVGGNTFPRGVHPPERKEFSADAPIEIMPAPEKVLLPLLQNIGGPSASVVKAKQAVAFGEMIAKATGFVSVPIHSPITGKALKEAVCTLPNGRHLKAIPIQAEGGQLSGKALWDEIFGGDWEKDRLDKYSPQEIVKAIQDAGLVGLGGAAFPTHVKFTPNDKKPVDTVLINGCECEPYLTSDYRMMLEAPEPIIAGALLAGRAAGAKTIIIGIEDNKPEAIEVMTRAAAGTGVQILPLKTKYPQGSEKQLIFAVLKREVAPPPGLPLDVGVAVSNVSTAAAIARAVIRKKPLTHRVICVTGAGVVKPKNVLAPMGISYGQLIEFCGGLTKDAARIISGGPMMGFAFTDYDTPVTKGTSGVTVLTDADVKKAEETNCVRCGKCVDACPMNLVPTKIAMASRYKEVDLAKQYNIMACFECGCCAYTCPASIPLVQLVRTGKAMVMAAGRK
ncbi:MAG: electron transport complex subunit RsxC [Desulfobacteraceae bacterium IS3]|nr:MAG: electron transport complex subunit RsxC [Desulfobacteraceae bacterium IS3]